MDLGPCRICVHAFFPSGQRSRRVTIPNTGYGLERHARRWFSRGASRVLVTAYSNSTGRVVAAESFFQYKEMK